MKRYGWIPLFCIVAIPAMGQNRYVETYEGSRIAAPMPLDSALTANVLDLADSEIYSAAFIRYDQRGDTALHETLLDTRRDFKLSGDSLWLYRQEWVNRYFQPDSMILYLPDGAVRPYSARMRQDQCIHSLVAGEFRANVYAPQTLVVAPGDTLRGAMAQYYRLDGNIAYTDYDYNRADSVEYPVCFETVYWYAPGLRHPSAAWERYSYMGDSVPAVQYEKTYLFPSYENRAVPPMASNTPPSESAASTGRYVLATGEDISEALASFDTFTVSGSFNGRVLQPDGTAGLTIETAAGCGTCSILLCDIAGRVYLSRLVHGDSVNIDRLPPGEYLLAIRENDNCYLHKIRIL